MLLDTSLDQFAVKGIIWVELALARLYGHPCIFICEVEICTSDHTPTRARGGGFVNTPVGNVRRSIPECHRALNPNDLAAQVVNGVPSHHQGRFVEVR
jgi:hypothetical protein